MTGALKRVGPGSRPTAVIIDESASWPQSWPDVPLKAATPLFDPQWAERFIRQEAYWATASGDFRKVDDLDPMHALNAAAWMLDNATRILLTMAVGTAADLQANPNVGSDDPAIRGRLIVADSPLFLALLRRAAAFERPGTPPWER